MSTKTFSLLAMVFLITATCVSYIPSFSVPFYVDDTDFFAANRVVQHFDLARMWASDPGPNRFLTTLSFAVNAKFADGASGAYHWINFLIHLASVLLVWRLVLWMLEPHGGQKPALSGSALAAAVFALHPVQTEAVTYLTQRYASVAALMVLASLVSFLEASRRPAFKWVAVACAVLTAFTKENAATLPALIFLVWWFRLRKDGERPPLRLGFWLLTPALMVMTRLVWPVHHLDPFPSSPTWTGWFATEMGVIWTYLRLLVCPVDQHFWYDVSVYRGLSDVPALAAFVGHVGVILAAMAIGRRRPLVLFAVLFFYVTIAVESGLFRIPGYAMEYRLYLPSVGFCTLVGYGFMRLLGRQGVGQAAVVAAVAVILLSSSTYRRNVFWTDPEKFAMENVEKAPKNSEALVNAANFLTKSDRCDEAEGLINRALQTPQFNVYAFLSGARIALCRHDFDLANRYFDFLASYLRMPDEGVVLPGKLDLLMQMSLYHLMTGAPEKAVPFLKRVLKADPQGSAWSLLIVCLVKAGNLKEALLASQSAFTATGHPCERNQAAYIEKALGERVSLDPTIIPEATGIMRSSYLALAR